MLYPLLFAPQFIPKVWGGNKLASYLDLKPFAKTTGEAWLISGVSGKESVVMNGFLEGNNLNELLEIYMGELVGEQVYDQCGNQFPVLVKILDTNDNLSIQAHPKHEIDSKNSGKEEMWYVLDSGEQSKIYLGFRQDRTRIEVEHAIRNKNIPDLLNQYEARQGDLFYIPHGRIHALGPDLLIAEIQQTSDTTFRLFDWDRTDRELHIEEGLRILDYKASDDLIEYSRVNNMTNDLGKYEAFDARMIILDKPLGKDYAGLDSFVIYLVTEGSIELQAMDHRIKVQQGYAVLMPAECNEVEIYPQSPTKIIEISQ